MGSRVDLALAILNGTIGDHLARTGNGLATPMAFMHEGRPIVMDRESLADVWSAATGRVVVLVHGLMNTESIWQFPDGGDYGSMLARDGGYTPLYLRYNTGIAIADNGMAFSHLLDLLVAAYPVPLEEILLVGYSMGGLVIRSACHAAREGTTTWLPRVRKAVYVGTPHLGAPAERLGRFVTRVLDAVDDPYTDLIADIAKLRSQGLRDLGDAVIRHEDHKQGNVGIRLGDWRHPVPLLPGIEHHLVAGTLSGDPWLATLFGDSMVPVHSATAGVRTDPDAPIPADHVKIVTGLSHVALAHHPEVYAHLREWCGSP